MKLKSAKKKNVTQASIHQNPHAKAYSQMRQHPKHYLYRDELSGFIDQMTKQGREGSRQFFLEGWNGDGAYSYDTIGRGNTYIDGGSVAK